MRNKFKKYHLKPYNKLSATFKHRHKVAGASNLIVTLDDALEFIERKNQETEKRKETINNKPEKLNRKQLFGLAKGQSTIRKNQGKITLAKVSILDSKED